MPQELFLAPPFSVLWAGRDPFAAAEALDGQVFRALEGRRTLRTEIGGRAYFVKTHRGVGWREIIKNLVSLRLPVLGAGHEWRAVRRLEALGIGTLQPLAYGARGWNPARRQSFLISAALEPTVSLEDHCRAWSATPPPPAEKRALIAAVADLARRMHAGGVNHRDFYLCHILLHTDVAPGAAWPRLSLIDLHRSQVRRRTPRRWRDKDLAGLYFSALAIGLTRRDRLRFLRAYFPGPLRDTLRREARRLAWLEDEAQRLQRRFARKFAPAAEQSA